MSKHDKDIKTTNDHGQTLGCAGLASFQMCYYNSQHDECDIRFRLHNESPEITRTTMMYIRSPMTLFVNVMII